MLPGGLRVFDRLGSTPEGTLYHAEYLTGVEVALLVLRPETGGVKPSRRERLDQAIQIQHINVAAMYEVGELGDGSLYVVLEQLVGEPLSKLAAAGRVFALPEAFDLALQAAAGLQAAHRAGFVHGDLSPHTILVTPAAYGRVQLKLIRFTLDPALRQAGVAHPIPEEASAPYASPERLAGHPPDERSDVFSLGAVLHHLLTGMPPDSGNVDSSVPKVARAVLSTALAPAPAQRFQTISEFKAALERLAALAAKPNRSSTNRALVLGAVGAGLALVAAAILLLPGSRWPAASEERPGPVARTKDLERAVPGPSTAHEASSATPAARPPAPTPSAARVEPTPYDSIVVTTMTGLDVIARLSDTTVAAIRELNPQYPGLATPPAAGSVIRLPTGRGPATAAAYAELPPEQRVTFVQHVVAPGETMWGIARRYGVSSSLLAEANPKVKARGLRVGQLLLVPTGGISTSVARRIAAPTAPAGTSASGFHRVRPGETLSGIADEYRVTQRDLQRWNSLGREGHIRAGQRLRVAPPERSGAPSAPTPARSPPPEERAQVYLRIGLDGAWRQLGRPVHAIEGMTPLFLGLALSRFPPYIDTLRPVVRAVYIGPNGSLILLDQQRIRPEGKVPAATATSWRIGDVLLHLHGEARPEVLRSLVRRVR